MQGGQTDRRLHQQHPGPRPPLFFSIAYNGDGSYTFFLSFISSLTQYLASTYCAHSAKAHSLAFAAQKQAAHQGATCPASLFSLQLHQEARATLTRASSSVQAATVTVMGARALLADLEGTCALLSPRLNAHDSHLDLPQPGQAWLQTTEVQSCGHKPRGQLLPSEPLLWLLVSPHIMCHSPGTCPRGHPSPDHMQRI